MFIISLRGCDGEALLGKCQKTMKELELCYRLENLYDTI